MTLRKRWLVWTLGLNLFVSLLFGSWMMYVAFQDNNQGEFFDPATGDLALAHDAMFLFANVGIPFVFITGIEAAVCVAAVLILRRRWPSSRS
ncbi:hypothetical protein [Dongia sp.]|uniref:hypothetical protein n=1 Tax=Dongia sp. TaxID=1977262 RepID=UPI0035AE2DCA